MLSPVDLAEAVPMLPHELDDIARLLDLVEQWLRGDDEGRDLLTDWLRRLGDQTTSTRTAHRVIDELGATSVTLHHILRADTPDTRHTHPPTR